MNISRHNELPTTDYGLEMTIATALKDCPPETLFLASVSGGADSTAMLVALAAMGDAQPGFILRCIHVEHGIRPAAESRGDAEFVRSLCNTFKVPCHVTSIKPGKVAALAKSRGIGIEAAARMYRRRAWRRHLRRLETEGQRPPTVRILVAHTADDMRETTLLRILRGSGPSGLAAMPANRGRILRPLITLSRRDVLDYLAEKKIAWREDSTNTDTQFLRNRIRRLLIPQLNDNFPQWGGAITALAETQSLTAEFIRKEAKRRVKWGPNKAPHQGALTDNISIVPAQEKSTVSGDGKPPLGGCTRRGWGGGNAALGNGLMHSLFTPTKAFFSQPAIIREEALFQGINRLGIPAKIKRANIRRFAQDKLTALDLGQLQIRRDSHHITIQATEKDDFDPLPHSSFLIPHSSFAEPYFSLLIKAPGSYNLKGIAIEVADVLPADYHPEDVPPDVFFSRLPLVFRPCFGEFSGALAVAEDALGTAAFIGPGGLLQSRDDKGRRCAVRVTALLEAVQNEGMNVRRQK